jgi:hypothetical protein
MTGWADEIAAGLDAFSHAGPGAAHEAMAPPVNPMGVVWAAWLGK